MIYAVFMLGTIVFYAFVAVNWRSTALYADGTSAWRRIGKSHYAGREKKNYLYCILQCTVLFLIAALRSYKVGNDTGRYITHFQDCSRMSWSRLFSTYDEEPGFYVLAKLISLFTDNAQWLFVVIALLFSVALFQFVFTLSKDSQVSFFLLIPFQFFGFTLSGLRQTMALSIVLISYKYVKERKIWKFLLCILLATVFHKSALFAVPLYFLYGIKMTAAKRAVYLVLMAVVYAFRLPIIRYGLQWFYTDYTAYDNEVGSLTTLVLYICIWILYVVLCGSSYADRHSGFEAVLMMGIMLQTFVAYEPNIFRLAMYYQISVLLLVPEILQSPKLDKRLRPIIYAAFWALMFLMYFRFTYYAAGMNPYKFFWQ